MTDISQSFSSPAAAPTTARLGVLDSLRGMAALGVVVRHFTAAFYPTSMTGNPATAHLPGTWEADFAASPLLLNFRICFLFVLSGLVLAESAARMERGLRPLLAQLVRRYLRLGVPVAAGMVLAWGLLQLQVFRNTNVAALSGAAWFASFWREVPAFGTLCHDVLGGGLVQGATAYNPVLWTMPVEWRGSVLVLGLLAVAGRWRWRLLLYAALALGLTLGRFNFYYVAFLLGLGLHDVYRRQWVAQLGGTTRRLLVVALLVVAVAAASHPQIFYRGDATAYAWQRLPGVSPDRTVQFYHTLGAVALLAAVLVSARLRRLADVGLLRRVGRRAFALYITHFLWLGSGASALFVVLLHSGRSYHLSFGLVALASGIVLWLITQAFYHGIEGPSHRLARWASNKILNTAPRSQQGPQ